MYCVGVCLSPHALGDIPLNENQCRSLVLARSGGRCERCGGIGRSYHHRKKRGQGGEWDPTNIVRLCGTGTTGCHGWVEEHPNEAQTQGFHVRPWERPDEVPVKWQRSKWYLLLPDGEMSDSGRKQRQQEDSDLAPEGDELLPDEDGEFPYPSAVQAQGEAE